MGKIGGLVLVATLALTGCTAAPAAQPERVANVQPRTGLQSDMLTELRPLLKTLKASDADILAEAYGVCVTLVFRDKDSFRESLLKEYDDVTLGLDHLTVAAAAKQYLCR